MKNILSFLKFLGLAVILLAIDMLLTIQLKPEQSLFEDGLLALAFLVLVAFSLFLAKRYDLISKQGFLDLLKWSNLGVLGKYIGIGLGLRILAILVLIVETGGEAMTENQEALNNLGISPLLLGVMVVIMAPIVEEVICRGFIQQKMFNNSYLGLAVSSLFFGYLHGPTNIGSWIMYAGMGLAFGLGVKETKRLETSIALHFLNNLPAFIALLMVR